LSGQPAVLQVIILRDGLLVGTEVFVPGQYTLGSVEGVDLRLDDGSVQAHHANLFFQNGRAAIQDAGSGAVFVNGHKVNACEVRPVDEISCGPFTLKVRVLASKPAAARAGPSPEVQAMLDGPTARPQVSAPAAVPQASVRPAPVPATVVSSRRSAAAPQASTPEPVAPRPSHLRPVDTVPFDEVETHTESVLLGDHVDATDPQATVPLAPTRPAPVPAARQPARPAPAQARPAMPERTAQERAHRPAPQARRASPHATARPTVPPSNEGKGKARLFVDLYWGDVRRVARSYPRIDPRKKLVAREDEQADLPLFGFGLADKDFVFAEQQGELYRVFVPPGAQVERRTGSDDFVAVDPETLEVTKGHSRSVVLGAGHALRLTGGDGMTVLAYVQAAIPRPVVSPFKGLPWLVLGNLAVLGTAFISFAIIANQRTEGSDFQAKSVNLVAVKLIAPPKKEEQKKIEERIKEIKKEAPKKADPVSKVEKQLPKQVAPETKQALKSVEKLAAAGPAMKDLLAAVDKLGSGPGKKGAKNDLKLSGLIGSQAIASAGVGSFGLGGGGGGGLGIKGSELLHGKGGGGIGALGAGNIGKGSVGGSVSHAVTRDVGAQGSIDKDAVAKAINSHLHEVSSCYERALLKEPGLTGKIVLEWQITTSGGVGYAKTKSSSMKSSAVEQCILASLKGWKFPAAKGTGVVITYPFMFNSVGY
jgi:hypothetical protein